VINPKQIEKTKPIKKNKKWILHSFIKTKTTKIQTIHSRKRKIKTKKTRYYFYF